MHLQTAQDVGMGALTSHVAVDIERIELVGMPSRRHRHDLPSSLPSSFCRICAFVPYQIVVFLILVTLGLVYVISSVHLPWLTPL